MKVKPLNSDTALSEAENTSFGRILQAALSVLAVVFSGYMIWATIFGPWRTTLVHLALFMIVMMIIYFLDNRMGPRGRLMRCYDVLCVLIATVSVGHLIIDYDRIVNLWGATYLSTADLVAGTGMIIVVVEAARRQSLAFCGLSVVSALYVIFGQYVPGVLQHSGMEYDRFIYLTAYTEEGIFGIGLSVVASYLFMFMLLGSALTTTRTGNFIIGMANAGAGRRVGGPAKAAMLASAGLGTMVGSSIGNVVSTGTFTIPLMKRSGFKPHSAAAIEVLSSEGSQLLPPIMGTGAFLMAEFTGIPYASIAVAALFPALLYFTSAFYVIHTEALKSGVGTLPENEIPSGRQVFADGWHLLLAPGVLFWLLMVENYSPAYAGIVSIGVALVVAMTRKTSRYGWRELLRVFDEGARQTAGLTGLIAAIGLVQMAMMTTGLAGRITEILLALSLGDPLLTALLMVVTATILGMGMPTPIAYLLLALFGAEAMQQVGFSLLATHLFIFYFAIKSGSTPPVAVVAMVAAGIAKANWWLTGVTAFRYSLPGYIVAFKLLYSPPILFQGAWWEVVFCVLIALGGVLGAAGAVQGWFGCWLRGPERALLIAVSVMTIPYSIGLNLLAIFILATHFALRRHFSTTSNPTLSSS